MMHSLNALITRRGNRYGLASPVQRRSYAISPRWRRWLTTRCAIGSRASRSRVTAEGFLALYEAGRLSPAHTLKERASA